MTLFILEVMVVQISGTFKMPTIANYNGNGYPLDHFETFKCRMNFWFCYLVKIHQEPNLYQEK